MKSTKKKVILSVCLAALFACIAVVSGVMLALNLGKSKSNATSLATTDPSSLTTPSKMQLTSQVTSITPGGSFTIHVKFTTRPGRIWDSMQALLVPVDGDGNPDYDLCQYFEMVSYKKPNKLDANESFDDYSTSVVDKFDYAKFTKDTGLLFMLNIGTDVEEPTSKDCEFEVTLKAKDNLPTDKDITFNIQNSYAKNFITTTATGTAKQTDRANATLFSANDLKFSSRVANTKAEIESIKITVDVKGDPATVDYLIEADDFVNGNYNLTLPDTSDLDLLVFYPTMKEDSKGATVKAGATASQTTAPATLTALAEEGTEITVSGTNRYLYIQATPEDGNTANIKVYTVKLTFTYARLSNLTATSTGFTDTSITKYDLDLEATDGAFDPDTFAYTAYVPEGTTSTTVTPTLAVDYGASTTITVVKDGAYQIVGNKNNVNNGAELYLQNIENGDKISFKVTAQDGTTTQTYEITFEIVTTDTSLKELIVTGNKSEKEIPNNEDKATEAGKDYYFFVGEDPAEAKITITPNDENATVEVKKVGGEYEPYDPDKVYNLGEYVIKVTASAGNTKEYTLVLEKFDGFKLKDGSDFALIALVADESSGDEDALFRRTYAELGWTHGVDDLDIARYVLGEIAAEETTLSDLVDNFSTEQLSKICVYDAYDTTLYDGANGGIVSGYAGELVCTSWKIVYGTGASADTIYVSVLGDSDGDGMLSTMDSAKVNNYIAGKIDNEELEVLLALHIENDGYVSTMDSADLNTVIAGTKGLSMEDFFRANASI